MYFFKISVDDRNFARAHIPYLRFDGGARAKHCWPDEAKDSNDGKCKDFNSKAPIYYDVVDCADKYRKVSFPVLAEILLRIKNILLLGRSILLAKRPRTTIEMALDS